MYHYQYCLDGRDITGQWHDREDATEVRIWSEDATLIVCADKMPDGWHISASDEVGNWTSYADTAHEHYSDAIKAMFATEDHRHWWDIRLSLPVKLMGAITRWVPCRECALCGRRTPETAVALSMARTGPSGQGE